MRNINIKITRKKNKFYKNTNLIILINYNLKKIWCNLKLILKITEKIKLEINDKNKINKL